jgi:RNA polymerase primary sigma factor
MATTTTQPPGGDDTPADGPLLDLTDAGVKKFIKQAKARGYVTMDELNKVLPSEEVTSEQIEDTLAMLSEMGVNVVENDEAEEQSGTAEAGGEVVVREDTAVAETTESKPAFDRTDDPVRMYLREMGAVELLSREGEIAIAKRIEAGRNAMIRGLCESALTFEAIMAWRDELAQGRILLREIIDLEQTYVSIHGAPANQAAPGSIPPHVTGANGSAAAAAAGPPPRRARKRKRPPSPPTPRASPKRTSTTARAPPSRPWRPTCARA